MQRKRGGWRNYQLIRRKQADEYSRTYNINNARNRTVIGGTFRCSLYNRNTVKNRVTR